MSLLLRFIFFFLLYSFSGVQAQKVWLSASRDTVKIGEPFVIRLHVSHDKANEIEFPVAPENVDDLVLIENNAPAKWSEDDKELGKSVRIQAYVATVFGLDSTFVQIPVTVKGKELLPTPLKLIIVSTLEGKSGNTFKDIAPLAAFPPNYWAWIILILGLIFGLGLAYFLYQKFFKKVTELGTAPEVKEERVAFKWAMATLEELKKTDFDNKEAVENYFVILSDVFRTYIESELHISAKEMTSAELLAALQNQSRIPVSQDSLKALSQAFSIADLVKFADYQASKNQSLEALEHLKTCIIRIETKIRPEY